MGNIYFPGTKKSAQKYMANVCTEFLARENLLRLAGGCYCCCCVAQLAEIRGQRIHAVAHIIG